MSRILAALICAAVCAAAEGASLLPADPAAAAKAFPFGDHTKRCSATPFEVTGQPFTAGLRIAVVGKAEHDFEVNRLCILPGKVAKGEVLELGFWARGTATGDAKPSLRAIHQLKDKPWTPALYQGFFLSGEWTLYRIAWTAVADWEGQSHRVAFFMGTVADQQIEMGPITLVSHGQIDPATLGIPVYKPAK